MTTNVGPTVVKHVATKESCAKINDSMTELCSRILKFGAANREHWENLQEKERFDAIYSRQEFKEFKEIIDTYTLVIAMLLKHNFYHHLAFKKFIKLLHQEGDKVVNPAVFKKCLAKYVRFLYQMLNPGASTKKLDEIEKETFEGAVKQEVEFQESVKNAAKKIKENEQKINQENANDFKKMIVSTKNTKNLINDLIKLTEESKRNAAKSEVVYRGAKVSAMDEIPQGGLVFENPNVPVVNVNPVAAKHKKNTNTVVATSDLKSIDEH
jgi:hypothetical protein